jgi:hypothetical protein
MTEIVMLGVSACRHEAKVVERAIALVPIDMVDDVALPDAPMGLRVNQAVKVASLSAAPLVAN